MSKPGPIPPGDSANFETILSAANNDDLVLASAIRKSDGQRVSLLCAMGRDGDAYLMSPLAVMIEGNPFELFEDPTKV